MKKDPVGLKYLFLFLACASVFFFTKQAHFTFPQSVSSTIFSASILSTLLFWESRVAIVFLGISALVITRTIDIEHLILSSSLEVILFLVGMMVIVGLIREVNFFNWVLCHLICLKNMSAKKLIVILCLSSALLACLVDEVTSIIIMTSLVFVLADYFKVNPIPLLMMTIMSTNIGSTGTVLGNPIGILIATKSGLTFEDFLFRAFPLMVLVLIVTIAILLFWYRHEISKMDVKIKHVGTDKQVFRKSVCVPLTKDIRNEGLVFFTTLIFIALHHRLEYMFGLPKNTLLLSIPLISAGFIMLWRRERARDYIENHVDWWTLIFFLLLFAQVGTLKYTGVTGNISKYVASIADGNQFFLISFVLWAAAIGSSIFDNVLLVSTFIPVIEALKNIGIETTVLWWALLFGGCLGGNITMVGSTANIVALGMLEKKDKLHINFFQWLKIGLVVGLVSTAIVWFFLVTFKSFFSVLS